MAAAAPSADELKDQHEDNEILYLPITSKETLLNCSSLDGSEQSTLFIASYPKSGTTW